MPFLTVFLTAGANPELQQVHEDFFTYLESLDKSSPDVADITVLREADVKNICKGKDSPEDVVKSLESFIATKKPKPVKRDQKDKKRTSVDLETPLSIVLFSSFPDTIEQFTAIVETPTQHPLIDSVIRLVMKLPGEDMMK